MGKAQSLRTGGAWLLFGEVAEKGCTFLRLMLLTHFITKDEVGIAGVFILVLSFFDLLTDLGVHNLLLHDEKEDPKLLDAVHAMMAVRGAGLAAVMFLTAPVLAHYFYPPAGEPAAALLGGQANLAESLRWFALVPLIRGFCNYDNNIALRRQNYRPMVALTVIPPLVMVALAWPVAWYFSQEGRQGYNVMLVLIIAQEVSRAVVTQLVAIGKFRWHFGKAYRDRIIAYGGPLLINGFLMFLYSLGDRALIQSAGTVFGPAFGHTGYPPAEWADYTIAIQLASAPVMIVAKMLSRIALPLMAKTQHDLSRFAYRYRSALALTSVTGALLVVGLALLGCWAAVVFFGEQYATAGRFMGVVALLQTLAMLKAVPTSALLALGDTRGTLAMTAWRAAMIVPCAVIAAFNWDMWWMIVMGAVGEVVAIGVVYRRLVRRDRQFAYGQIRSLVFLAAAAAVAIAAERYSEPGGIALLARATIRSMVGGAETVSFAWMTFGWPLITTTLLCLMTLVAGRAVFPELGNQVLRMARGKLASDQSAAPVASAPVTPGEKLDAAEAHAFTEELAREADVDPADPTVAADRAAPPVEAVLGDFESPEDDPS